MRDPQPNYQLQAAREQKMWTLEDAAAAAGVDAQTFWRWENQVQRPRAYSLRRLCEAFEQSSEALGFGKAPEDLDPAKSVDSEKTDHDHSVEAEQSLVRLSREQAEWIANLLSGDDMPFDASRRATLLATLKAAGIVIAAPYLINAEPWERLTLAATKPSVLNRQTLDHFSDLMRITWEFSNGTELEVAERMLPQFLPRLIQVAQYQPEAAVLASQGLQLRSILIAHKLKIAGKIALCQQAVEHAKFAPQDQNTLVAALLQLAVAYSYDKQHDNAMKSYHEALTYCAGDQVAPLLRSRAYIEAAATFAQFKRAREADFYLGLALESFPDDPEHDPTYLYADHGPGVLALYQGMIYLERGDATQAWNGFESFKTHRLATPERIRLEIVNHQGRAALLEQDLEKYVFCLDSGLSGATRLGNTV